MNGWRVGVVAAVCGGLAALACQPPRGGRGMADAAAIRRAHLEMQAASARADWAAWAAMHAEGAVVMLPHRPALEGREAIRAYFQDWPAFGGDGVELLEIETRGDLGYVRGRYRISMALPGGLVADSGKTLEIWRKDPDGRWRVTREMSTSDVPAGR